MQLHAVHNPAHAEFANAEVEVAPFEGLLANIAESGHIGVVARC